MADRLAELESKRLKVVAQTKKDYRNGIFGLLGILLGVIFLLVLPQVPFLAILCFIGGVITVAFFFGKAGAKIMNLKAELKKDLVTTLLEEEFEGVVYDPKGYISVETIMSTRTVKKPDRFTGEDYIRGHYKGVQFEVSDVDLKERHVHRDSHGNTHVTYETYFKGRWYVYTFDKDFHKVLKIMESQSPMFSNQGLVKVETESIQFNKKFNVYASDLEFGFYHITPSMIEKLMTFEQMHRGSILYCFRNNELHIGVDDKKDYMEVSYRTPITKETLGGLLDQIELLPAVINEFRLDSSKFKK